MKDKISEYRKTHGRPQPQSRSRWTVCWFHIDFCQQLSASHDAPAAAKLALIGILAPITLVKDEGGETQREAETEPRGSGGVDFLLLFLFQRSKDLFYYDGQVHH